MCGRMEEGVRAMEINDRIFTNLLCQRGTDILTSQSTDRRDFDLSDL